MTSRPTLTLKEAAEAMRAAGFRTSPTKIADGIECGRYPFGTMVSCGKTGRRQFEILRVDFEKWMNEVTQ